MQQQVGAYGLSTGVIPSLGAVNREGNLRRYIIFPDDRYYRIWKAVMVTLAVYSLWVSCFELGFLKKPPAVVSIIDNVINGVFFVDVILRLFVAHKDKTTYLLVDNPREIFWEKKWGLVLDTLSSVPVEVGMIFHSHRGYRITYIIFNLFRCWRVVRSFGFLSQLEKDTNLNYTLVRCMKLIFVALFSVHAAGCLYYLIAESYFDPDRTWIGKTMESFLREYLWKRYVASIYWAITTLTSVGFGDIHPVNEWEMFFGACYMLLNIALGSYIAGSIAAIIFHELCRTKLLHLKEDPALEGIFKETGKKLARGGMDLPVDLCFVAGKGTYFSLRKFLKKGRDPDESDKMGRTALHIVAAKGDVDRVKLLLDYGADPNIRDSDGNVPLWLAMLQEHASSGKHERVTTLLAGNGATLERGDVGAYACRAVELNNTHLLNHIMRVGGNLSAQTDSTGTTALHAAVLQDNIEMVKFLIVHGAKIDQKDKYGCSPRQLAYQQELQEIIAILPDEEC